MKKNKSRIFLMLFLMLFSISLTAQESTEKIKEEYTVPINNNYSEIRVRNLSGSVSIETYSGKTLLLEATKTIKSRSETYLAKGKSEIKLAVYKYDDGLFIYMDHPCAIFDPEKLKLDYHCENIGNYSRQDYKFNMDIQIKVPENIGFVDVGTVNGGEVYIRGLACNLDASNINGPVIVEDHSGNIEASTINGDLTINFSKNPESYAEFSTINGKIEVNCLKNLSAKIQYKTMHGDFYTNYDDVVFLPTAVKTSENKHSGSTRYRLNNINAFKIGGGESDFSFKTLNGNMFLKSK